MKSINETGKIYNTKLVFIKGVVLGQILYGDLYYRDFSDVDIIVPKDQLLSIKKPMNDIGFYDTYTCYDRILQVKEPSNTMLGIYHEYYFTKKVEYEYYWVELKSHTSAIKEKYIDEFNSNSQFVDIGGYKFRSHNIVYTFLHLCSNTFGNCEHRMIAKDSFKIKDFIDVYVLINKYSTDFDWKKISDLANKFELLHKVYYVLNGINEIYSNFITNDIIELFSIDKITYNCSVTNYGTVVAWETPFIDRLFSDDEERNSEYERLYCERAHSTLNLKRNDILKVIDYTEDNILNLSQYRNMICSKDSGISFRFNMFRDNKNKQLIITISVKKDLFNTLDNIFLNFDFYVKSQEYKYSPKIVRLSIYKEERFSLFGECIRKMDNSLTYTNEEVIMYYEVEDEFLMGFYDELFIPYNLYVFKKIFEEGPEVIVGVKYGEEGYEEESPNLGMIQW